MPKVTQVTMAVTVLMITAVHLFRSSQSGSSWKHGLPFHFIHDAKN